MFRKFHKILMITVMAAGILTLPISAQAKEKVIGEGIHIGQIDVSGMTEQQAKDAVNAYVSELGSQPITLVGAEGNTLQTTAAELGLYWENAGITLQAGELGKNGNVVQRYKELHTIKTNTRTFDLELGMDAEKVKALLQEQALVYDRPAVNATLKRVDGAFQIEDGQIGYALNVEDSANKIINTVCESTQASPMTVELTINEERPQGDAETLAMVKDVLGTYTTSYGSSTTDRAKNIANGCKLVNGYTLYPGESISIIDKLSPFTSENGYYAAGSYLNGQVVDSIGGGICQVSTTLYNAVLRAELQVDQRYNHSMVVSYVDPSEDAAIASSSGKDFIFTNSSQYPIYIEGYTGGAKITFNIYGVETRPADRQVIFESVILSTTVPPTDTIIQDPSQPIGYCVVNQGVHIGYQAQLWKTVKEGGVQVSREQVNSSTYKAVGRTVTVGVATADPNAYAQIQAAIATGSYDTVKAVAAALTTPAPVPDPVPVITDGTTDAVTP